MPLPNRSVIFHLLRCSIHHLCFEKIQTSCLPASQLALTGIQPSGKPHLGNYLSVLRPCLQLLQNKQISKLFFLIADLHAITSTSGLALSSGIHELTAAIVSCGFSDLTGTGYSVFRQSDVFGHCELAWILSTQCSTSRLAHLPQWKEKSSVSQSTQTFPICTDSGASVGLFTYPVLQAADILLYGAEFVPVGADQTVHIELARDLVRDCIRRWPALAPLLPIPECLIFGIPKIQSLKFPEKKMSKSDPSGDGCIFLTDSPDVIQQKIRGAQTDSVRSIAYDPKGRPGVSNLLQILATIQDIKMDQLLIQASHWNKETLKSKVTDAVVSELNPIRQRMEMLIGTPGGRSELNKYLRVGSEVATRIASSRIKSIYSSIGCGRSLTVDYGNPDTQLSDLA